MEENDPRFEEITDQSEPVPVPQRKDSSIPAPAPIPEGGFSSSEKGSVFFKKRPKESEENAFPENTEGPSQSASFEAGQSVSETGPSLSEDTNVIAQGQQGKEESAAPIAPSPRAPEPRAYHPTIVINPNPTPKPENNFSSKPDIFSEDEDVEEDEEEKDKKPWLQIGGILLAIALSALALMISLGIIPYDKEISGKNIEPSSIDSLSVADSTITREKLDGALQEDLDKGGPTGPAGARGPRGPLGARGPAGITGLQSVSETTGGSSIAPVTLVSSCPVGTIAISGGVTLRGAESAAIITESEPVEDFSGWRGGASPQKGESGDWSLRVWSVCAEPSKALEKSLE